MIKIVEKDKTKEEPKEKRDCGCELTAEGWNRCKKHKDKKSFYITKQPAQLEEEHNERILSQAAALKEKEGEAAKVNASEEEKKVVKFIFDDLQQSITSYAGPSGRKYTINKGLPFEVKDSEDKKFFDEHSGFSRQGIFSKKPKPQKDVDELLSDKLKGIKGLSKKVIDKVVELYLSEDHLKDVIFEDGKLDISIPKHPADKIIKLIGKEEKEMNKGD